LRSPRFQRMAPKPSVENFLDLLEEMAPRRISEEWDNPGLQVGDPSMAFDRVLLSLDPTHGAVKAAAQRKAQVLLSHHPLLFRPLSCLDRTRYPGSVLFEALKSGVSLIAAHTNLDAAQGGLNDMLAGLLHLENLLPMHGGQYPSGALTGLGRIGFLPQPATLSATAKMVKSVLSIERVRVAGDMEAMVKRVAVVAGSGGSMLQTASDMGADLLITGDVGHHHAMEAIHMGMALVDAGHFQTEKAAIRLFSEALKAAMERRRWDVLVETFDAEEDPLRYA